MTIARLPSSQERLREALDDIDRQSEKSKLLFLEGFDGLVARFPPGVSPLLLTLVRQIQSFLLSRNTPERARTLLQIVRSGGMDDDWSGTAYEWGRINPGELLALRLLVTIHKELDLESGRFLEMVLGVSGAKEAKRLAASKKPRRPEVNNWIRRQLIADISAKAPDLWRRAPNSVKDLVGEGRFAKRVTQVRKLLKSDAT